MGGCVLVIGSTCVDVVIRVDHLPRREENLHPAGQRFRIGGCAYNVANILGRGGAEVAFVTPVGLRGVFGPYLLPQLEKQPWVRPVPLPEAENGCCYCLVERDGERTFLSIHGAEYTFAPEWMPAGESWDYAYVCGLEAEESTGDALVSWLERAPVRTLFYAPGPRGIRVPAERTERLLALRPVLHLNRQEALALSGQEDPGEAARQLRGRTGSAVIVTLGADGALVSDAEGSAILPGEKAGHIVDTIGAGDAHAGAVLLGLSRGESLRDSVRLANRVAAQAVRTEGATLPEDALRAALGSFLKP